MMYWRKSVFMKLVMFVVVLFTVSTVSAATWSSSEQYGNWSNGGYIVYNNIWGSGAGPQSIWANSYSNWGVWADHPNTGGIKSYPNSTRDIGARISTLSSLSSSFNVTVPSSGSSFVSAYDIWAGNYAYEIMLWMNYVGGVKPISYNWDASGNPVPVNTNVSVGGHTWNVYRGSNGSNEVFSFVRTSNTNAGTIDVLAIMNWIKARGWYGDEIVDRVQFGFEITSSSGGKDFISNSYSVAFASGGANYVKLRNRATGLNIDSIGRTTNGSIAGQWSNSSSFNQQWLIESAGSYVKLKNRASGLYLDGNGQTANGAAAILSSGSSNNQQWTEEIVGSYVKYKNRATGLYLDGMGRTSNGSDLGQWSNSTSNNQQFQKIAP